MAEIRSKEEFRQYSGKVAWPIAPILLIEAARTHGAPASFIEELERVPNRVYLSEGDFWSEYQSLIKRARAA